MRKKNQIEVEKIKKQVRPQLWSPIPRDPDKRKKKEKPTPGRIINNTERAKDLVKTITGTKVF